MGNGLTAMNKQHILTYGLNLSPTRASFQKMPNAPFLLRSIMLGHSACRYVDVQIVRRSTMRRDWKLKMAVWSNQS